MRLAQTVPQTGHSLVRPETAQQEGGVIAVAGGLGLLGGRDSQAELSLVESFVVMKYFHLIRPMRAQPGSLAWWWWKEGMKPPSPLWAMTRLKRPRLVSLNIW